MSPDQFTALAKGLGYAEAEIEKALALLGDRIALVHSIDARGIQLAHGARIHREVLR